MEEDFPSSQAGNKGSGQAVSVTTVLSDSTAKWLVIVILGLLGMYGTTKASQAYDLAQRADMEYTLVYTHAVKEDAWLQAHGVDVSKFGELPKPKENE